MLKNRMVEHNKEKQIKTDLQNENELDTNIA